MEQKHFFFFFRFQNISTQTLTTELGQVQQDCLSSVYHNIKANSPLDWLPTFTKLLTEQLGERPHQHLSSLQHFWSLLYTTWELLWLQDNQTKTQNSCMCFPAVPSDAPPPSTETNEASGVRWKHVVGVWEGSHTSMHIKTLTLQPCTAAVAVTGVRFAVKTYIWYLWCPSRCCWCPLTCWALSAAHEWVSEWRRREPQRWQIRVATLRIRWTGTWDSSSLLGPKASCSQNQHSCRRTHWVAGCFSI